MTGSGQDGGYGEHSWRDANEHPEDSPGRDRGTPPPEPPPSGEWGGQWSGQQPGQHPGQQPGQTDDHTSWGQPQQGRGGDYWRPTDEAPTYGAPQEEHPSTVTAFIFALLAVPGAFMCGITIFFAIPGLIMGRQAQHDMRANPGRYKNEGLANAAVVLSGIGIGLLVLGILVIAVFIITAVSIDSGNAGFNTLAPFPL